ncbi:MAG: Bax inhibitor-1 family protein [Candidatus Aenigmatarchaeota archaeon]
MKKKTFQTKVMPIFTLTVLLTFLSSFIGLQYVEILSNIFIFILMVIASLIVLIFLKRQRNNILLLLLFNFLEGLILVPLIYMANLTDPKIIPEAFGVTTLTFIIFFSIGWFVKKDLSSLGGILLALLILTLVLTFLQRFITSTFFNLAIDAGIAVLFMVMVVYDINMILNSYSDKDYISAVVSLYLDFFNIFVRIVLILIRLRRKRL